MSCTAMRRPAVGFTLGRNMNQTRVSRRDQRHTGQMIFMTAIDNCDGRAGLLQPTIAVITESYVPIFRSGDGIRGVGPIDETILIKFAHHPVVDQILDRYSAHGRVVRRHNALHVAQPLD
jgi:hypothetical protein